MKPQPKHYIELRIPKTPSPHPEPSRTICAKCKYMSYGRGVAELDSYGQTPPPPTRPTTERGDVICLRHPRGRTPVDVVTGLGGVPKALYCADVNDGACPDFSPAGLVDVFKRNVGWGKYQ